MSAKAGCARSSLGQVALRQGDRGGAARGRDRPRRALGEGRALGAAGRALDRGCPRARRRARRALRRRVARRPRPREPWSARASLRRRAALLALRPDLDVRDLRGNVDTRLRRLADGDFDAIVLATGRPRPARPRRRGRAARPRRWSCPRPARAAWCWRRATPDERGPGGRPSPIATLSPASPPSAPSFAHSTPRVTRRSARIV